MASVYTVLAQDTFHRADENPLNTAIWSGGNDAPPGDETSCQIISNECCPTTADNFDNVATYTAITWPNDQWAQVQCDVLNNSDGNQNSAIILAMRSTSNTIGYGTSHYNFEVDGPLGPSCNVSIYAHLNSEIQQFFLGSAEADAVIALNAGDFIRMELIDNTLSAYTIHDGVSTQIVAPTIIEPTSFRASGNVGLQLYENIGGADTDAQVSNFSGGGVVRNSMCGCGL